MKQGNLRQSTMFYNDPRRNIQFWQLFTLKEMYQIIIIISKYLYTLYSDDILNLFENSECDDKIPTLY